MHAEALGGGVAEFDAAIENRACPFLNQLGEVALGEMRSVFEQIEAGNHDALGELAEKLAVAAEQKAAARKEAGTQTHEKQAGQEEAPVPVDAEADSHMVAGAKPAEQFRLEPERVRAGGDGEDAEMAAIRAEVDQIFAEEPGVDADEKIVPAVLLPKPVAIVANVDHVDDMAVEVAANHAKAVTHEAVAAIANAVDAGFVEEDVPVAPEERAVSVHSRAAAEQTAAAQDAARLKVVEAHEAAEQVLVLEPETAEADVVLAEAAVATMRQAGADETTLADFAEAALVDTDETEAASAASYADTLPELPIFDFQAEDDASLAVGELQPKIAVPDFLPDNLLDGTAVREAPEVGNAEDGLDETFGRFAEALHLRIAAEASVPVTDAIEAAEPAGLSLDGEIAAVELPQAPETIAVPAIAVTVAERLDSLEPEQQAAITPVLQEIEETVLVLDTLHGGTAAPAEAGEPSAPFVAAELPGQPFESIEHELMETVTEQLDEHIAILFEQLGVDEYTEEDVRQFRDVLMDLDFQSVEPAIAEVEDVDPEREGTREAKRHLVQLVSDGIADVEYHAERLLGKIVLLHSPGGGWLKQGAA